MSEQVYRWGILGNAYIARQAVIPALQKADNTIVHALASRNPASAQKYAQETDIPNVVDGYAALLADPDIDAVYIPLPNNLHKPWAIKALEAGKHVLCEKPLALNATEAKAMAAAAEANNRLLMEAFMYRFHPRTKKIKQIVAAGEIGEPRLIHAAFCFTLADANNIRFDPSMGGGALMDVGSYGVSVASSLAAAPVVGVKAQAQFGVTGVDLTTTALLEFENGCLATIHCSFASALQQTYSIIGTTGSIELPHNAFIPFDNDAVYYTRGRDDEKPIQHSIQGVDEYVLMVESFTRTAQGRQPSEIPLQESINAMTILDAVAKASQSRL